MLNITHNSIDSFVRKVPLKSLRKVEKRTSGRVFMRLITALFALLLVIMFVPWTQNIQSNGLVTTLKPDQRPQTLHSVIAGRVEKWYVKEGDYVERGDTILYISEIKDKYFDPQLLGRTQQQVEAKKMSARSYDSKVEALETQINALKEGRQLKLQQAQNKLKQSRLKVKSDSIDFQAATTNYEIASQQYGRLQKLYDAGLKSLTDLENRKLKMQQAQAKLISAENKLLTSKNEVLNAKVELTSIRAQYDKDIAKSVSEKFSALSGKYNAEAGVTKLQNEYVNYSMRNGMYYITAPQNGYITKTMISGIGETIKEGEKILSIMPAEYDLAVEMYIKPIDLPLLQKGQDVRIQFDGWPAIVFSGWPNTSYGTYGGEIFAIDNFISENGKYRVLVSPDPEDHPWPDALRVGSGTSSLVLLKDVPIWYELWRKLNGFPPDYYKNNQKDTSKDKEKKA